VLRPPAASFAITPRLTRSLIFVSGKPERGQAIYDWSATTAKPRADCFFVPFADDSCNGDSYSPKGRHESQSVGKAATVSTCGIAVLRAQLSNRTGFPMDDRVFRIDGAIRIYKVGIRASSVHQIGSPSSIRGCAVSLTWSCEADGECSQSVSHSINRVSAGMDAMDHFLQMLLRMLPIIIFIGLRSLLEQPATPRPNRTPRDARPFQLPPRQRIRRNRVDLRSSGLQQAAPQAANSSHPMWDAWLDM
jgi:hypothetical protein